MNYSATQAGNLAAVAGLIVSVAAYFGYSFLQPADVSAVLGAIVTIVGIGISWYDQVAKGNSTVTGFIPAA